MTDREDPVESGAATVADVFKDEEPEVEAQAETPEPESKGETETEETEEVTEEATAETETTEETTESTVEPPSTEQKSVPVQALVDVRRRAQTAEAEVSRLRAKYEPTDENAPDPISDPEGYKNYLKAQWESERWTEVTNKSREKMLEIHSDYEEMEKYFITMARDDTSLIQKMRDHYDPAKFAYDTAKESRGKYEAEVEKRVLEKLKKEGKLKEPKPSAPEVATLIKSPGAGKNNEKTVNEITNVKDLF